MRIHLTPQRRHDRLNLETQGDTLIVNGEAFDFASVPEGATLPRDAVDCAWLVSDVDRVDGAIVLTLILPHGPDASRLVRFPDPIIDPADGPVALPGARA